MTTQDSIETLEARFRSGNSVPVERAHITADEWTELKQGIAEVKALREENERLTRDRDAKSARMWELGHECDRLEAQLAQLKERESMLCDQLGKANAQLAALQAGPNASVLSEYINRMRVDFNSNGGFRIGDILAQAAAYLNDKHPAAPISAIPPGYAVELPFAILPDEMAALQRFHECAMDDEGYDVPKPMMKRLAEIGLLRRVTANYYEHTTFGLSVLNGDFAAAPAIQPQTAPNTQEKGE